MTAMMAQPSSDQLLDAAANLDKESFNHFVRQILALQAQRHSHTIPAAEAELLKQINLGIALKTWQKYDTLKAKRQAATLTPTEHEELIAIGNKIEIANAQRIFALSQLATLRNAPLEELMEELGIRAPKVE